MNLAKIVEDKQNINDQQNGEKILEGTQIKKFRPAARYPNYPPPPNQPYYDNGQYNHGSYYNRNDYNSYPNNAPTYPQHQYYNSYNKSNTSYHWQHQNYQQPYHHDQMNYPNGFNDYNNANYKQYHTKNEDDALLSCASKAQPTQSIIIHKRNVNTIKKDSTETRIKSTLVLTSSNLKQEVEPLYKKYNGNNATPYNNIIIVKPLLILDINGILCYRAKTKSKTQDDEGNTIQYKPSAGYIACTDIILRSDLPKLLNFLHANFTLSIWTSAKLKNATKILDLLLPPNIRQCLLFTWGQDACDYKETTEAEKGFVFMKSLDKVWEMYPLWNASNTILMDDTREKILEEHVGNVIHPPPILGTMKVMKDNPDVSIDMDEENQKKQFDFFYDFAQFWINKTIYAADCVTKITTKMNTHAGSNHKNDNQINNRNVDDETNDQNVLDESIDNMASYLKKYAVDHMGWDGKDETQGSIKGISSDESLEDKFKTIDALGDDQDMNDDQDDNEVQLGEDDRIAYYLSYI